MKPIVFFDIELSDLPENNGEIIEMCLIKYDATNFAEISRFHSYIKPLVPLKDVAVEITAISNEFLSDKPEFGKVHEDVIRSITGSQLIGKYIELDIPMLNAAFEVNASDFRINISDCTELMDIEEKLGLSKHDNESVADSLGLALAQPKNAMSTCLLYRDIFCSKNKPK